MNSMEFLEAMGLIRGKYIEEAHLEAPPKAKTIPFRRTLLIAAIVSLMLLLAGCVAVLLGLDALDLGKQTYDAGFGIQETQDRISLQGYMGSPNYQAALEWHQYLDTIDQIQAAREADARGYQPPDRYRAYICFSREMEEKIDAICEKYGLQPLGREEYHENPPVSLGLGSIAPENVVTPGGGYCYEDGTFQLGGTLSLTEGTILFQYRAVKKTAFDGVALTIGDKEVFQQWTLPLEDGRELQLAMSEEKALIFADSESYFVTVNLLLNLSAEDDGTHWELDRQDLEAIARLFSFDLSAPPQTEPGEVEGESYQDILSALGDGSAYGLWDLNGDGTKELLTGRSDGSLEKIYTQRNGTVSLLIQGEALYLCEGSVIEQVLTLQGRRDRSYYRIRQGEMELIECIMYSESLNAWYWSESGSAGSLGWEPITEEVYRDVMARYPRVSLPWVADSPVSGGSGGDALPDALADTLDRGASFCASDSGRMMTLTEYCAALEETSGVSLEISQYTAADLDGDGQPELLFRLQVKGSVDYGTLVLCEPQGMAVGHVLSYRQLMELKEDGTFWCSGSDYDGPARLQFTGGGMAVEILRLPGENQDSKANVSWQDWPLQETE